MSDEFQPEPAKTLSDGLITLIESDGRKIQLDLVGSMEKLADIQNQHQGKPLFEFLRAVIAWVEDATGHELNLTQAQELPVFLEKLYLTKKKQQEDDTNELRESLGIST